MAAISQEIEEAWKSGDVKVDRSAHSRPTEEKAYVEAELTRRNLDKQWTKAKAPGK